MGSSWRWIVLVGGLGLGACGARGGVLDPEAAAPAGDDEGDPVGDPGGDPADPGGDPLGDPDPVDDPRVLHRRFCTRVAAVRDDAVTSPECAARWDVAAEAVRPEDDVFESAVVRLDLDSGAVSEVAFEGAAYGTFGRRDHDVLDDAEEYLPMGIEPEIWSPDDGSHLIAVRRAEAPAGSVVVSPLLAARAGDAEGAIERPDDWRDAAPLDQGCPSAVQLDACGIDARTGVELPEEDTRAALESVLGTVLPDLVWRGAYIFDTMVVRWAPTPDDEGELFVVIAGGWLE